MGAFTKHPHIVSNEVRLVTKKYRYTNGEAQSQIDLFTAFALTPKTKRGGRVYEGHGYKGGDTEVIFQLGGQGGDGGACKGVISKETEKSEDDWDHLLVIDFGDIPEINETGLLPFVCKIGKSKRNKKKAIENFQLYYSEVGPSLSNGKPLTQEEAAREALAIDICKRFSRLEEERPEKEDPRAFIILIRLESKIELNALADTGSDINVMPYLIYAKLGREEVKKVNRGITMLNHSKAKLMGVLKDVMCQVGVTTIIAKFLILGMPIDRDAPILVGRGFLYTYGSILNTRDRITYTFDGVCHQTFRAAKTSLNTEESDNDDEEDYGI
ncbi:DNA-directed DNA polymerase [Tanacetum coccineum]